MNNKTKVKFRANQIGFGVRKVEIEFGSDQRSEEILTTGLGRVRLESLGRSGQAGQHFSSRCRHLIPMSECYSGTH